MEIDRNHLPEAPAVLRKMVVGLLEELDSQGQRFRQVQHLLEQLLRARYGPKRERVSENQLFLFAVAMLSAGPQTAPAPEKSEASPPPRAGHGRQRPPKTLERRRVASERSPFTPTQVAGHLSEWLGACDYGLILNSEAG